MSPMIRAAGAGAALTLTAGLLTLASWSGPAATIAPQANQATQATQANQATPATPATTLALPNAPVVQAKPTPRPTTTEKPTVIATPTAVARPVVQRSAPVVQTTAKPITTAAPHVTTTTLPVNRRMTPTAAQVQSAIDGFGQFLPISPSADQVAQVANQVCTAFDQGQTYAQVEASAEQTLSSVPLVSDVPGAANYAVHQAVALYCPGYSAKV